MATNSTPNLAAVIGWPIAHSLSPLIHKTWAKREGQAAYYIPVAAEENYAAFVKAADSLKALGFAGANVTIPHKEHALKYCNFASADATAAGAANMITFGEDRTFADNSDIAGFANGLEAVLTKNDNKNNAVILGAGGAASGVGLALKRLGFTSILIANRTRAKADRLVDQLSENATAISWDDRNDALPVCDVLINTTSLGMTGKPPLEVDVTLLSKNAIVSDIVYTPLQTVLLKAAVKQKHRIMDGLSMLMHQAVPGYKAWLGEEAAVDTDLRKRLETALKERERP